jgi:predicted MPP superfamily phosphohydrolase
MNSDHVSAWAKRSLYVFVFLSMASLGDIACETFTARVHDYVIADEDIPTDFDGFRIAFITDIHHGPLLSTERVASLVAQVNRLKPDLILMGGDYVHRGTRYIEPCFSELGKLAAPAGVFGVLGNHDHWDGADLTRAAMRRNGIGALDNAGVWIVRGKTRIRLGGVGDLWTDRQDTAAALGSAKKGDFVVLVSHNPDFAHTHGGQISFFGVYAPFLPTKTGQKYRSGLVDAGSCRVIVSNGTGTITPPLRFFAPAEIVVVTLRSENQGRIAGPLLWRQGENEARRRAVENEAGASARPGDQVASGKGRAFYLGRPHE